MSKKAQSEPQRCSKQIYELWRTQSSTPTQNTYFGTRNFETRIFDETQNFDSTHNGVIVTGVSSVQI